MTKPGSSGALTYTYVGAGFWQRTNQSGASIDATLDAFTYGVSTPDAATPRSGAGVYSADLLAVVQSTGGDTYSIGGTGRFDVNFGSGDINVTAHGMGPASNPQLGSGQFDLTGSAKMSSSANGFSGTVNTMGPIAPMSGSIDGRFYGPNADEVGATFAVSGAGGAGVGTLIGRSTTSGTGETLAALSGPTTMQTFSDKLTYIQFNSASSLPPGTIGEGPVSDIGDDNSLTVDPAAGTYKFADAFLSSEFMISDVGFGPGDLDTAHSNSRFTVYQRKVPVANTTITETLTLYKPGASNDELVLNYAGFGNLVLDDLANGADHSSVGRFWFTYGLATDPANVPRAGKANYAGLLYGEAGTGSAILPLTGTANFDFDLGAGTFDASLKPVMTDGGTSYQLGTYGFQGSILSTGNTFSSFSFSAPSNSPAAQGTMRGQFFGPSAQEVGASFRVYSTASPLPAGGDMDLVGVAVAKQH